MSLVDVLTVAPAGSTGSNTHASFQLPNFEVLAMEFVVEAVGATPTVSWKFQGSIDNSNWYDLPYVTESDLLFAADSSHAAANSVAPGALATIASLAAPPAGIYSVKVSTQTGAGSVAADNGNMKLQRGGVDLIPALPTLSGADVIIDRVALTGAQTLAVLSIGAATAAVVYTAKISATPLVLTNRVSTAVGRSVQFLSNPFNRRFKFVRCVTSANTNVTYRAEVRTVEE